MTAVAELTTARIFALIRDENDRLEWVEAGTIEAPPNPEVALSYWFAEQEGYQIPTDYVAELPDGRRSDQVRWPDPLRPVRSRALGAR